jgi:phage-related protein
LYTLKIKNARGEIFELTHNSPNYLVTDVQGLTPPPTTISTATGGAIDGTFFNSARVNQRNIVITVVLCGDIERNRQQLYKIFNLKNPCEIWFKNERRDVKITGYVETLECDLFKLRESAQISIICPRPYFEDLDAIYTELSNVVRMFEFPFAIEQDDPIPFSEIVDYPLCTINNNGDVECGVVMDISITDTVTGLTIYDTTAQTFFGFDYTFAAGDVIHLDTRSGQMGVTLTRGGIVTNLLNYVTQNSTWFKLLVGDNDFTVGATSGASAVNIMIASAALYGGV